jgi:hypothetical protein
MSGKVKTNNGGSVSHRGPDVSMKLPRNAINAQLALNDLADLKCRSHMQRFSLIRPNQGAYRRKRKRWEVASMPAALNYIWSSYVPTGVDGTLSPISLGRVSRFSFQSVSGPHVAAQIAVSEQVRRNFLSDSYTILPTTYSLVPPPRRRPKISRTCRPILIRCSIRQVSFPIGRFTVVITPPRADREQLDRHPARPNPG